MRSESVLLIGGNGYIGSALAPLLLGRCERVTVLSRRAVPVGQRIRGVSYVQGDFSDSTLLGKLLDTHPLVVHLAYATVPNTSFANPLADLTQNLVPTVALFEGVAQRSGTLFFISSGGTVYGEARQLPITEEHALHPISPYGVTKATLENYAYLYAVTKGLKYVCVRPSNPFGPGQRPFVGQGFVATALGSAIKGCPVDIFGYQGTIRDYIYIDDLARGLEGIITQGKLSETYNLGSGIGRSNLDVVSAINRIIESDGLHLEINRLEPRPFDVAVNILDSSKVTQLVGWRSVVSFEDGMRLTYQSISNELD